MDSPAAFAALLVDAATAAAAAWNAAWFIVHAATTPSPGRRTASNAMALVNGGIAVQSIAAQALYAAWFSGRDVAPYFDPNAWLLARVLLLAGTLAISLLILRRRP
jgi:hypothetical protein